MNHYYALNKIAHSSVFALSYVKNYEIMNSSPESGGSEETNRLKIGSQMAKLLTVE